MDSNFAEWMYLKQIVGSFDGLTQYYFGAISYLGPWFRQAAVGVLYSLGLAWAGFCFAKAPIDRLKAGLSVLGMVVLAGFLLSPTTNTKNLGSGSGRELSVGGYYAYTLAGTMTQVFQDVLTASWKNSVVEAAGGGGPGKDALALAFNDKADQFAEKFIKSEGKEAVTDYWKQCGPEAISQAKSSKDKEILKAVGIGANTLGMSAEDASFLTQYVERLRNNNNDFITENVASIMPYFVLYGYSKNQAAAMEDRREMGKEFLTGLPTANSRILGTKGYRIPTSTFYKEQLSNQTQSPNSTDPLYKTLSNSNGELQKMTPNGLDSVPPGSDEDFKFYPKNCYDLYLVASETMRSLRDGVKGQPGYENLALTQAFVSLTAANAVRRGFNDELNAIAKEAGIDHEFKESQWEELTDTYSGAMTSFGAKMNKWMLEYKIPGMVASMSLLVAVLIISFPIFALISVVFGPGPLITYLKMMFFPFIVVFVNDLLLSVSANIISFNKVVEVIPNTFTPGGVDVSISMAGMNTEAVVYLVICGAEIAIARLLLWDDVKSITNFKAGATGTEIASQGQSVAGKIAGLAVMGFSRSARAFSASKQRQQTTAIGSQLASISQSVSTIASGGRRGQVQSGMNNGSSSQPGSSRKSNRGSDGWSGGGGPGGADGGGKPPLVPDKK